MEHLPYEEVDYWEELCGIMDWSRTHVYSTMHICWGAQAGLYYHYGIDKHLLPQKMFGIFPQKLCDEYNFLTNGFDEIHMTPHSRHTAIDEEQLRRVRSGWPCSLAADSSGSNIMRYCRTYRQIFHAGSLWSTAWRRWPRNTSAVSPGHKPIQIPVNYFPDDDPSRPPVLTWRSHANLLYRNWLNYVYQMTPYQLNEIEELPRPKHV